ncbi:N-acetylmuramoyl-L-alanine amidase [Thermodesulfitimonas autotrophica]|uniref:N-acetylmuramoyl-L-alanine amidase n=1 Tax=Thermodesulfitimonas autotrophica TaxID=1894989 RepID=A0A3N5B293_9THEO|nr:N-acetylmuramoyl-L-alanine amidase [Thermodesulfitimonas autotrophica]RPF49680.1 N-acetylmuramoyl-L-alanine amidase [Thermodesulfitimonas autotrophica]
MRVCLDPGHGGYDPGAVGPGGLKEKDVTLAVALRAGFYLQESGAEVFFTRASDRVSWLPEVGRDLAARVEIANRGQADLYLSIHCNSAPTPEAGGIETYSFRQMGKAAEVARLIQAELVRELGLRDRGVKTAGFYVLRHTAMPAVLTELAFISNPREEKLLSDPGFQERAAKALARAVAVHYGLVLAPAPAAPRLVIDNRAVTGVPLQVIEGRTWVELRPFVAASGGTVEWNQETKTIVVYLKP